MGLKQEIYNELNNQDWASIIKKLTIYAVYQFKFWGLVSDKGIKGYSPQEIVYEAIEKVYIGEWKWDPNKSELTQYLKYHVVRGLVANLARSEEVRKSNSIELDSHKVINHYSVDHSGSAEYNAQLIIEFIKRKIGDDKVVLLIFDGYCNGLKRKDICEIHEEITPNDFNNAYRRFQRIIKGLDKKSILNSIL